MCKFLSAIVLRNGDVYTAPLASDSHEDLVRSLGLSDNGRDEFTRVEYIPENNQYADIDMYKLRIDEQVRPDWFGESVKVES